MNRPDWWNYYLDIAKAVSARGDCVRAQHGCVIVKDNKTISTGYNGTPQGDPSSCGATGQCPRALDPTAQHSVGNYDLCWATHAEANALLRASWSDMQGATAYITGMPCSGCWKLLRSSGIREVVYRDGDGIEVVGTWRRDLHNA
jgi:dCMP deaminase